jgi:sugar lactone lactonase YvrE
MKRKALFVGALFLALGVTLLLSQQRQRVLSKDGQVPGPAGRFPAFIPMPGVTPRGVAVDKVGNVYVSGSVGTGVNEHIWVWKYTPAGEEMSSVDIGQGTIGGLMVTANGDLYIAMAAGVDRGVWRVDRKGNIELLPGSNQIYYANGLAFDDRGTLYITESNTLVSMDPSPVYGLGGIWRIPRGGQAEPFLHHEYLTGTDVLPPPTPPMGANGIAYFHGDLYVTNTEKGTVVRIPVQKDGSLGAPELWTTLADVPESPLYKAPLPVCGDGIALDVHGNLYVAVLTRSAVVRINAQDLSQETVAVFMGLSPVGPPPDAPFDFPASLFFGTGKGERQNLFVTNLGVGKMFVPALPWAGPGLVKIDAGVPGDPLH